MTDQPADAVRFVVRTVLNGGILEAFAALADAEQGCMVGNEPASRSHGLPTCAQTATWAFRTHDGVVDAPSDVCPAVVLVCDEHLTSIRRAIRRNLSRAGRVGVRIQCGTCKAWTTRIDDVIWGIERLKP